MILAVERKRDKPCVNQLDNMSDCGTRRPLCRTNRFAYVGGQLRYIPAGSGIADLVCELLLPQELR